MNLTILPGPPLSGKTSMTPKTIATFQNRSIEAGVVKFDCLYVDDNVAYEKASAPVKKGLSGALCPNHFFASSIEEIVQWGNRISPDLLISKPTGLCSRCSLCLKDIKGICVIDNLSGIGTPKKIGPLLKSVDVVVITKGDTMSQAGCEVFASHVSLVSPRAAVIHVNDLTGQGAYELGTLAYDESRRVDLVRGTQLRFPIPAILCSYCLDETRIGENCQLGNVRKMDLGEGPV